MCLNDLGSAFIENPVYIEGHHQELAGAPPKRPLTAGEKIMQQQPLLLDPAICNWVLMPIVLVMVLVMILRDKVRPTRDDTFVDVEDIIQLTPDVRFVNR